MAWSGSSSAPTGACSIVRSTPSASAPSTTLPTTRYPASSSSRAGSAPHVTSTSVPSWLSDTVCRVPCCSSGLPRPGTGWPRGRSSWTEYPSTTRPTLAPLNESPEAAPAWHRCRKAAAAAPASSANSSTTRRPTGRPATASSRNGRGLVPRAGGGGRSASCFCGRRCCCSCCVEHPAAWATRRSRRSCAAVSNAL